MENLKQTEATVPKITVFIAVYNGEIYLRQAIISILNQTFADFELLIINDGSTDNSQSIIEQFKDPRIRLLNNGINRGLTYTRNRGVREAKAKYIAVLDSDDIAFENRLALQYDFMESNPHIVICGGQAKKINDCGEEIGKYLVPIDTLHLREEMIFRNIFINPSCMIRRDVIQKLGGYRDYAPAEDFDLSFRLLTQYEGANLDVFLVKYREHTNNSSISNDKVRFQEKRIIRNMHQQLGLKIDEKLITIHHRIFLEKENTCQLTDIKSLFVAIINANRYVKIYDDLFLSEYIFRRWVSIIRMYRINRWALPYYFNRHLFRWRFFIFKDFRKVFKASLRGALDLRGEGTS